MTPVKDWNIVNAWLLVATPSFEAMHHCSWDAAGSLGAPLLFTPAARFTPECFVTADSHVSQEIGPLLFRVRGRENHDFRVRGKAKKVVALTVSRPDNADHPLLALRAEGHSPEGMMEVIRRAITWSLAEAHVFYWLALNGNTYFSQHFEKPSSTLRLDSVMRQKFCEDLGSVDHLITLSGPLAKRWITERINARLYSMI